jgi:hypothetical protein
MASFKPEEVQFLEEMGNGVRRPLHSGVLCTFPGRHTDTHTHTHTDGALPLQRAKEIWLARWTPRDYPEPESTDRTRVREFMKLKYERKKWCVLKQFLLRARDGS